MAVAPNIARLLTLTARKSDIAYRITMMMNTTQQLANENAEILNQKSAAIQNYMTSLTAGTDAAPVINVLDSAEIANFDVQLQALAIAQNKLDLEQKKMETQHKAVCAEEEGVQKLADNNIKEEMSYFKD